jgi:hypothetical protein
VSTHAPNKTSEDYRIFGVKQKSLHPKNPMRSFKNLKKIAFPYHKKTISASNDDTKGSCTGAYQRWTPRECQSARKDQDRDQSIGL